MYSHVDYLAFVYSNTHPGIARFHLPRYGPPLARQTHKAFVCLATTIAYCTMYKEA